MVKTQTVIVTGGAKGIGASISRSFYDHGYHVVIGARQDNGFATKLGKRARFQATDVKVPQQLRDLVKYTLDWTGHLDVMVNNAGFSKWCPIEKVDEDLWGQMVDTNLKGTLFSCQAAAKFLQQNGCIINISSLAGKRGSANNAVYCATKFGVNGITQALAKELGPRGIRVNAVCPVYVQTPGLEKALREPAAPPHGKDVQIYLQEFAISNSALGMLPTGEEIGKACLFFASLEASAITGQCINIDCGVSPQ